jgi:hypothetical protein
MSDTPVAAPASTPAPAVPATPAAEAPPKREKANRFRTDAELATPIPGKVSQLPTHFTDKRDAEESARNTPPKDPATGKFVKQGGDPNAGVIDEMRAPGEGEAPPPPPANEPPPAEAPAFTPVRVNLGDGKTKVLNSQTEVDNFYRRIAESNAAADRRAAKLEADYQAALKASAPPASEAPPVEAPKFANPFEKSLIDDEPLMKQLIADINDPEKGPAIAIARITDQMEKRIADLVKFMNHQHEEAITPFKSFMGAMESINTTGNFFEGMRGETTEDGAPKYPALHEGTRGQRRKVVSQLTSFLHKHSLPLTPGNFDLAYSVVSASKSGEPPTIREQPPVDHSAAASAAAVGSGRGARVPDMRAEKRTPTVREEYDAVKLNRGRFRTEGT